MSDRPRMLIYGANGYTGRLIVQHVVALGMQPVLAGRNIEEIPSLAQEVGLEWRVVDLSDPNKLDEVLEGVTVVIHCAGPFSRTYLPMAAACIRSKVHYLDITGEIVAFEGLKAMHEKAKKAGVMLMPGVGFDVVPTDSLAAHLKRRLPDATRLTLGFMGLGSISHGTATTMVENLHQGSVVRENGAFKRIRSCERVKTIDFGLGPKLSMAIPWGDVSTAHHTTGITNIEVYTPIPKGMRPLLRASGYMGWLLGAKPLQSLLKTLIDNQPAGPDQETRDKGSSYIYGEVSNDSGEVAISRMVTPEGYNLTVLAAVAIADRVMRGGFEAGYQTPAGLYGPDMILEIDGVKRFDVS